MKRLLSLVVIGLSFVAFLTPASALSEDGLRAIMAKTYVINGVEYKISNDDLVLLDRYLAEYDVSEEDAQYIADRVDEAVEIIRATGATSIEDIPIGAKNQIKSLVEKVSANTSVVATVTDGNIVIYSPDGSSVFAEVSDLVKQTDNTDNTMVISASISAIVLLIGAFMVVRKSKATFNA